MHSIIKFLLACFIFSSISVYAQYAVVLYPIQTEDLKIDLNKKKEILYRGEKVNVFDNIIETDGTALTPPESLPDGKYIAFYKNDTSKLAFEVSYLNKKRDGIQKQYYLNRKIKFLENYSKGKKYGLSFHFLTDGEIQEVSNYKNGKLDGISEFYIKNGIKETEREYKNGKLNGVSKIWNARGILIKEEIYKNGKKKKVIEY